MRFTDRLSVPTSLFALLFIFAGLAAHARAQGSTSLFDAPWQGFDTGTFAVGFDPTGGPPAGLRANDLDGDGDLDLVTGNGSAVKPGITVLLGAGDGTYAPPAFYYLPDGKSVADVALSDVDRDGDADVLATAPDYNGLSNILALWRNHGDGTFAPYAHFSTGPGPRGIAVADFNGDGFEDVATANHGSVSRAHNTFSVVLHNGQPGAAAGFLAHSEFAVEGMDAQRVAAADLNGDGRPDLAVGGHSADHTGGRVAVLLNNGAGGFAPAAYYTSYPGARLPSPAVAFADLDRDGDADLIAAGMVTSGAQDRALIAVRRNAGDGTFGAPEAHVSESNLGSPHDFGLGDLNGDAYPDVVATTPTGRDMDGFIVLLSDGAGGFKPALHHGGSQMTSDAVVADVDRDGDGDLVTAAYSALAVTVHRNTGGGAWLVLPRIRVGQESGGLVGNVFGALEVGDLDRDGDLDIVTTDEKAYVLKNNGGGSFAEAAAYQPPINPAEVKLRDLDGDGHLDLLFGPDRNAPPYHFGTALNHGDGTFAAGTVVPVNACQAGSIDAADFDGDGDLDVVLAEEDSCAGAGGGGLFIFRNDGRGGFALATALDPPCLPQGLGVGDFNGDGRADIISTSCDGVGTFAGRGDLTFAPQVPTSVGGGPYRFKVADLDGDGRPDLAMIHTSYPASTTVVGTALGNGDGTFAAPRKQTGASGGQGLTVSSSVNTADVDGDGDQDVLVANYAANDVSLFYNEGDGRLRPHERYGAGAGPRFLAPADFDGDGAVDVATSVAVPTSVLLNSIVVLRNTRLDGALPHVTFTSPQSFEGFYTPSVVRVAAVVRPAAGRPVRKVEFYLGDENGLNLRLIRTDTTAPFEEFEIRDQAPGTYNLFAIPYDDVSSPSYGVAYVVKRLPRRLSITGRVTDAAGAALAGVDISLGGAWASHLTTGANGGYGFEGLTEGESYDVAAYKDNYEFTPVSRTFDSLSDHEVVNFVGRPRNFTVRGRLTLDGKPLAGASVRLSGSQNAQATTDAEGRYAFPDLAPGSSAVVTPLAEGHAFTPASADLSPLVADAVADFAAGPSGVVRYNHALASRGATATASSTMDANRAPLAAINGDRKGQNWGANPATGSGWHDATANKHPDWLEIGFAAAQAVDEVNVFSVQDNVNAPQTPTEAMTFTKYGVTDFSVEYWTGSAWQVVPGGAVTGNDRVYRKLTFPAVTTTKLRVAVAGALAGYSRLAEVEAWGPGQAPAFVNHALASSGAKAYASSTLDANRAPLAAINGDRKGQNWGADSATGSGWHDATGNNFPDWLEVVFTGERTVSEVHVFSVQDNVNAPAEPTEAMTFTRYGLTDFNVEYWTGTAWQIVPGGMVVSNHRVWSKVTFAPLRTTKIRVVAAGAQAGYSRIAELETWGQSAAAPAPAARVNHALASNGATAAASSTLDSNRAALAAINGDRRGQNWGSNPATGSGWHDATGNTYPDWLEVTFSGAKIISEVNVFSVQDNVTAPAEPTEGMTFTKHGVTGFDVEYWDGASWQVVPGGMVVSNNKVWARVTFAPLTTTKIRVVVRGALAGYSRLAEVEAY